MIAQSYTFGSTVNAFVLRGAKIVFVDIRQDTLNTDENLIEAAITENTKVIVPVHYAGISCEMDKILDIAKRHKLLIVEDAARGSRQNISVKVYGLLEHWCLTASMKRKLFNGG